mmetsp:Transcript_8375/g.21623  ORF Transcript_8375/g.21623 Transcript_8375/m.21623 type:complete len:92 (-) Transcript_8375:418-693(-)
MSSGAPKAIVKTVDMAEDMQTDAIEIAQEAIVSYIVEKDMANFIKKEFDKKYSPTWHVIIGKNWGAFVTHATKNFIYFYLGDMAILLFKSG